jgi:transcriptional regulator with XRE-family HTH domain
MLSEKNKTQGWTSAVQVGAAIRSRRLTAGLSQEALGFASNTHRTYIGSIERGEKAITVDKLVAISLALDCSASQILSDCGL